MIKALGFYTRFFSLDLPQNPHRCGDSRALSTHWLPDGDEPALTGGQRTHNQTTEAAEWLARHVCKGLGGRSYL